MVPRSEWIEGIKNNLIIRLIHTKLDENTNKVVRESEVLEKKFLNMGLSHSDMRKYQEIGNIGRKL